MCRISGMVTSEFPSVVGEGMVRAMCDLQKHGGPDDSGIFISEDERVILGNRRLALLDLSAAGHQPMGYRDELFITYNGELFNFPALKADLVSRGHLFKSNSDTEVILAAYDEWGTGAFPMFRGMFAFALYDKRINKFFLVRDPSGIKPLYYSVAFNSLVFASEVKAFSSVRLPYSEDSRWKIMLMAYGHIPEPLTTIREVAMLPKGTYLCYDTIAQRGDLYSYSHFSFSHKGRKDRESVVSGIRERLSASVERHLIADAPVGVFLSGGLDSSILFAIAASTGKKDLSCLSVVFDEEGFSEKKYQDEILDKYGAKRNQYLLGSEEFESSLPAILSDMDMPSCDGFNTWFISRYARQSGLKAVLSGLGADELFGGYPSFARMAKTEVLHNLPSTFLKSAGRAVGGKYARLAFLSLRGLKGYYLFLRGHFTPAGIARYLDASEKEVWNTLIEQSFPENAGGLSGGNLAGWIEMNMYMQNQLLRDADVMSMKHGVELRVPFLDEELVRFSLDIDQTLKFGGHTPKSLLIDSFRDAIPANIWKRPKMGFSLPYKKWLKSSGYAAGIMSGSGKKAQRALTCFRDEQISWSQYLSLLLINRHAGA